MPPNTTPKLNKYSCPDCLGHIITVDLDKGTTPFMLGCRATEGCAGKMTSSCYRGVTGTPTHAWRKPTPAEYQASSPPMRHHFDLGGLDIYVIQ